MDHPNNPSRIQRCNSLPSKFRRRSSLLRTRLRMETNPYIGSFRHSPPTSFRSMEASITKNPSKHFYFTSSPQTNFRTSPYIGWFRHAPPTSSSFKRVDWRQLELLEKCHVLAKVLNNLPQPKQPHASLASFINGRLCGGGQDRVYSDIEEMNRRGINLNNSIHQDFQETNIVQASAAANMLVKLGSWLLFPLADDPDADKYNKYEYGKNLKAIPEEIGYVGESDDDSIDETRSIDTDKDDSSVALSDFDGPISPINATVSANMAKTLGVSVSEIAEAYYAHQVIDQSEYASEDGDRLDYVITQADIARMARNAARHLDVDSILNLPTITYRSRRRFTKQETQAFDESRVADEGWSFIMVPENTTKAAPSDKNHDDDVDKVCVICLEPFNDGDRLRVLPCNHSFHVGCIDRWLSGSHSHTECFTSGCPTCKKRPALPSKDSAREQHCMPINDGSVPSWAFAELGSQLAQSMNE